MAINKLTNMNFEFKGAEDANIRSMSTEEVVRRAASVAKEVSGVEELEPVDLAQKAYQRYKALGIERAIVAYRLGESYQLLDGKYEALTRIDELVDTINSSRHTTAHISKIDLDSPKSIQDAFEQIDRVSAARGLGKLSESSVDDLRKLYEGTKLTSSDFTLIENTFFLKSYLEEYNEVEKQIKEKVDQIEKAGFNGEQISLSKKDLKPINKEIYDISVTLSDNLSITDLHKKSVDELTILLSKDGLGDEEKVLLERIIELKDKKAYINEQLSVLEDEKKSALEALKEGEAYQKLVEIDAEHLAPTHLNELLMELQECEGSSKRITEVDLFDRDSVNEVFEQIDIYAEDNNIMNLVSVPDGAPKPDKFSSLTSEQMSEVLKKMKKEDSRYVLVKESITLKEFAEKYAQTRADIVAFNKTTLEAFVKTSPIKGLDGYISLSSNSYLPTLSSLLSTNQGSSVQALSYNLLDAKSLQKAFEEIDLIGEARGFAPLSQMDAQEIRKMAELISPKDSNYAFIQEVAILKGHYEGLELATQKMIQNEEKLIEALKKDKAFATLISQDEDTIANSIERLLGELKRKGYPVHLPAGEAFDYNNLSHVNAALRSIDKVCIDEGIGKISKLSSGEIATLALNVSSGDDMYIILNQASVLKKHQEGLLKLKFAERGQKKALASILRKDTKDVDALESGLLVYDSVENVKGAIRAVKEAKAALIEYQEKKEAVNLVKRNVKMPAKEAAKRAATQTAQTATVNAVGGVAGGASGVAGGTSTVGAGAATGGTAGGAVGGAAGGAASGGGAAGGGIVATLGWPVIIAAIIIIALIAVVMIFSAFDLMYSNGNMNTTTGSITTSSTPSGGINKPSIDIEAHVFELDEQLSDLINSRVNDHNISVSGFVDVNTGNKAVIDTFDNTTITWFNGSGEVIESDSSNAFDLLAAIFVFPDEVDQISDETTCAYLDQLWKDTHVIDIEESPVYSCDSGCATGTYYCNDNSYYTKHYELYEDLLPFSESGCQDGSCPGHSISFCKGHVDAKVTVTILFVNDDNDAFFSNDSVGNTTGTNLSIVDGEYYSWDGWTEEKKVRLSKILEVANN